MNLPHLNIELHQLWEIPGGPQWNPKYHALLEDAHAKMLSRFQSGKVGFYEWPNQVTETQLSHIRQTAEHLHAEFDGVIIFGIGGSFLGPYAIAKALAQPDPNFEVHWLSNIDPQEIRRIGTVLEKDNLAAVVISKSGGTIETISSFFHFAERLTPEGYVVITDPESGLLRKLVKREGWKNFEVPPNVGGRFSVLTPVGLLPTALGKLDADALIQGAKDMKHALEHFTPADNPAYRLALGKFLWDTEHGHGIQYLMPYEQNLKPLADWYVQLWGESLGKRTTANSSRAVGFTPASALGTTDQHSLLQLFKEGPNNKVIGFMEILRDGEPMTIAKPPFAVEGHDFLFKHNFNEITHYASAATEKSLNNSHVPTYRIQFTELSEEALGAFFFFQEVACALAGELYGVDAYDQPGVEEAKKLLREAL